MLKHQLIVHPDLVFAGDGSITPYKRRVGLSWYLCPAKLGQEPVCLLINVEFGYTGIAQENNAAAIEEATLTAIELHLPDEHIEDNVSVSLNPADVSWHTPDKMPEHVALRYQQAQAELARCHNVLDAEDALEQLNEKPLNISGCNVAPTQGLEGLLEELAEDFRHYVETRPWYKLQWDWLIRKAPWLAQDYRQSPRSGRG